MLAVNSGIPAAYTLSGRHKPEEGEDVAGMEVGVVPEDKIAYKQNITTMGIRIRTF